MAWRPDSGTASRPRTVLCTNWLVFILGENPHRRGRSRTACRAGLLAHEAHDHLDDAVAPRHDGRGRSRSRLKISAKVWRLATLKKLSALIDMCRSTGSMPARNTPAATPALVDLAQALDGRHVELLDRLALRQVLAAVDVLGHHQADEVGVGELVVDREADQLAQRVLGRQVFQVQARSRSRGCAGRPLPARAMYRPSLLPK